MTSYPLMAQNEVPTMTAPIGIGWARTKSPVDTLKVLRPGLPRTTGYLNGSKNAPYPGRDRMTGPDHSTKREDQTIEKISLTIRAKCAFIPPLKRVGFPALISRNAGPVPRLKVADEGTLRQAR